MCFCYTNLYSAGGKFFRESYGQDKLSITQNSLATSEGTMKEFFSHHGQATWGNDISCMDETVKIHGGLVDLKKALVIEILGVWRITTQYHFHCFVESWDSIFQSIQIECIFDVVNLYFDEELVALQITEPLNPSSIATTF